ncbi:hypothetical protein AKO1_006466 [Acrasis kona]|uniref:Small ribosomal subunit protein uS10 domain-containing protein n=1 Tax=Acrasis kona TaxID=1008807 RepID=A0AAW2YIY2_9EUKA
MLRTLSPRPVVFAAARYAKKSENPLPQYQTHQPKVDHTFNVYHLLGPKPVEVAKVTAFDKNIINGGLRWLMKENHDRTKTFKDKLKVKAQTHQLALAVEMSKREVIPDPVFSNLEDFFFPTKERIYDDLEVNFTKRRETSTEYLTSLFGLLTTKIHTRPDYVVRFPIKYQNFTILKSPHVDKKARKQYEIRTHRVSLYSTLSFMNEQVFQPLREKQVGFRIREEIQN